MAASANVILQNEYGKDTEYSGVSRVVLDTDAGGTAEFVLGGGALPDYVVQIGDTLTELYFNSFCQFPEMSEAAALTLLACFADNTHKLDVVYVFDPSNIDVPHRVYAEITQGSDVELLELYGFAGWARLSLDLHKYNIGTVSACVDTSFSPPIYAKSPLKFGSVPALPSYLIQDGDRLSTLFFNPQSAEVLEMYIPLIFEMAFASGGATEPNTGLSFGDIGLGIFVGDLSTVGVGNGYCLFASDENGVTILFSTLAFDASAFLPGAIVTEPGWQTTMYSYPQPITVNYNDILSLIQTDGMMHCIWGKAPFSVTLA